MGFAIKDRALKVSRALPAAASATVYSDPIDFGHGSKGDLLAHVELEIVAPAVNTTMAPDTRTFKYFLQMDDDAAFGSPTLLATDVIVQTGAGGAGAATATAKFHPPVDCERYVRLGITSGASTTDASAVSATFQPLF